MSDGFIEKARGEMGILNLHSLERCIERHLRFSLKTGTTLVSFAPVYNQARFQ